MFIKFTIVLFVIYLLFKGVLGLYLNSLDSVSKIRISLKKYTDNESLVFLIFGLLYITTYVCTIVSIGILIWKLIGNIL